MLRLIKAIYSLNQLRREWFESLLVELIKCYTQSSFDLCVFIGKEIMVAVYIDDILVAGKLGSAASFKAILSEKFKYVDMGLCKYLLGLKIT